MANFKPLNAKKNTHKNCISAFRVDTYMERMDHGHGGDWVPHGAHPFIELILDLLGRAR